MTNLETSIELAKLGIEKKLENGMTDKQEIFAEIVTEFNIPRPVVRRIARDLRNKYLDKVKILQSDFDTHYRSRTRNDKPEESL